MPRWHRSLAHDIDFWHCCRTACRVQRQHSGLSAVARFEGSQVSQPSSEASLASSSRRAADADWSRVAAVGGGGLDGGIHTSRVATTYLRIWFGLRTKRNETGPLDTFRNQGTSALDSDGPATDRRLQIYKCAAIRPMIKGRTGHGGAHLPHLVPAARRGEGEGRPLLAASCSYRHIGGGVRSGGDTLSRLSLMLEVSGHDLKNNSSIQSIDPTAAKTGITGRGGHSRSVCSPPADCPQEAAPQSGNRCCSNDVTPWPSASPE